MSVTMSEILEVIHRYAPKDFKPKVGMILGSGLSSLAEQITNPISIPYQAIPGLHSGHVSGHASLLVLGYLNDVPVLCLRGRLHLYEECTYDHIRTLIRLVKYVGCETFIITCAAGSLHEEAGPGELMMINDHINMHPGNPLSGPNDESIGPRFVGMEDAYDPELRELLLDVADQHEIPMYEGVYLATLGPSFETPAEIRAFKIWGADAVGMSVVPEVLLARHCGLRVVCIAAITNLGAGMTNEKLTHAGTLQFGEIAARKLTKIMPDFVKRIHLASER